MKTELIFCGDNLLVEKFPDEVDIIYPNLPVPPLKNFKTEIEKALDNPLNSPSLSELIRSDSKVCIGFDDISIPVPPIRSPDPRSAVIEAILRRLEKIGVSKENISLICATGLHRKCKLKEIKHLIGKKVMVKYYNQIKNHNAEKTIRLETLPSGLVVDLNKVAAKADLIIYISIPYTPMNGGYKSVTVGLGSVESILQHHLPEILEKSPLMDPEHSEMHQIYQTMGQTIEKRIPIFQIEIPLNNNFYSSIFRWLWKPARGRKISSLRKIVLTLSRTAPYRVKSAIRKRYRASYQPIGIFAGDVTTVHTKALELVRKQAVINIPHHYDVLLLGIPNITPYNVDSDPNPLLIHALVYGYLSNAFLGHSVLKDQGIIIGFNPCRLEFDEKQHPNYRVVFEQMSPTNISSRNEDLEQLLLNNLEFLNLYRNDIAYHPLHSLLAYYWGSRGRKLTLKTIIVAKRADKEFLNKMGWELAPNLTHALISAKETLKKNEIAIIYPFLPPLSILQ